MRTFKFEAKLKELGFQESDMKKAIIQEIKEIREAVSEPDFDEAAVSEGDDAIVTMIETYAPHVEKMKKVAAGRERKRLEKSQPAPVVVPTPTPEPPAPAPVVEPTPPTPEPVTPPAPQEPETPTVVETTEDKKGGVTIGQVLAGAVILVGAFFGLKALRNN